MNNARRDARNRVCDRSPRAQRKRIPLAFRWYVSHNRDEFKNGERLQCVRDAKTSRTREARRETANEKTPIAKKPSRQLMRFDAKRFRAAPKTKDGGVHRGM